MSSVRSTSSSVVSHASRIRQQARWRVRQMRVTYGLTHFASSSTRDRGGWLSRMSATLSAWPWNESAWTWSEKATKSGRSFSQLVPRERHTKGSASSLWPTPTAQEDLGSIFGKNDQYRITSNGTIRRYTQTGNNCSLSLGRMVLWPTPQARDWRQGSPPESPNLPDLVPTGKLNPDWVSQMMGFPDGWLDIPAGQHHAGQSNTTGKRRARSQKRNPNEPAA